MSGVSDRSTEGDMIDGHGKPPVGHDRMVSTWEIVISDRLSRVGTPAPTTYHLDLSHCLLDSGANSN